MRGIKKLYYYLKDGPYVTPIKGFMDKVIEYKGVKLLPLGYITKDSIEKYKKLEYELKGRNTFESRGVAQYLGYHFKDTAAVKTLMNHMEYTERTYRKLKLQALAKGCKKCQFYLVVAGPESTLKKTVLIESKGILEFPIMNISGI